jgi:hypothetical protein
MDDHGKRIGMTSWFDSPSTRLSCVRAPLMQVPAQLRLSADLEASSKEKMAMLVNQKRYRELMFLLPDMASGKGKLKAMKKDWPPALH